MKTYEFTLYHDNGKTKIRVTAGNLERAQKLLMIAEDCPISAIQSWRIIPTAKQIKKTQSLLRGI